MSVLKELALAQVESKAIPNHPAFRSDAPTTTYVPGGSKTQRKQGELSQSEAARHMESYGGKDAIDWVMMCVDLYADTTSSAAWHFSKDGERHYLPDEPKPDDAPVVEQQLADLLVMPNPYMDYIELMQLVVIDLLLVGNAYWFKYKMNADGRPLALYRLSPLDVRVVPNAHGVTKYIYQPKGVKTKLDISPTEIIHFKRPNPSDPYYGMGVIRGGGRPLDLELALTDAQTHYFENKADPSMIVQSERRVPRDVFKKLTQQLRARAMGTRNSGELLVLEAGLKASTLDRSARDTMYKELAEQSRDRILAMFRLSPKLLGITEAGGGQDKVQDSRREFDNKVMRPFMDKLQSRITWGLTAAYGYEYKIDYKYIMPPEELVKLAGDVGAVPGIKVQEVRQFLVEGGIITSASTGDEDIDELVLNLPGEELDEDGQGGFADQPLPGEAGRPPAIEETRAIPRGGQTLPRGSKARRPKTKALPQDPAATLESVLARLSDLRSLNPEAKAVVALEDPKRATVGSKIPGEKRPQDTLEDARTQQLDSIIGSVSAELTDATHELGRSLRVDAGKEGKAFDLAGAVKRVRKSKAWSAFSASLGSILERGARQSASVAAIQHADFETDEELDYDTIAKKIVYRTDGAPSISDNLKAEIVKKVSKVSADGGDRKAVEGAINESIDFWDEHKATTVAMTEAVHAYNETALTVFENAGFTQVVVFDGEDHDEPCKEAAGSVWDISHARENRLEHPRCRRAFVAHREVDSSDG